MVQLPYEEGFDERQVITKAKPIQMNNQHLEVCGHKGQANPNE